MRGFPTPSPSGSETGGIRRPTRWLAALAVVALAAGTAGAGASSAKEAPDRSAKAGAASKADEETSPFTGLPAEPAPVMAVKIDNHKDARPHTELENADIVFVEKVEGGLSRLLGVFSSKFPEGIGPVRSARAYNVEQLRMFDRPVLAYSGAREGVVDLIKKSKLYGVSHDDYPDGYFRGGDNEAPHNLYSHTDKVLAQAPDASKSKDIGFRFADEAPGGGEATDERTVDYGSAQTTFNWSAEEDRWLASFDGEPAKTTGGARLGGATVVVQKVEMPPDDGGTPYEKTVGSGDATVLRDGKAYETKWERPTEESGTTFTKSDGERMAFDRGQVWVVYEEA
ncbi:hypothetical protein GCM10012287_24160 [Streptomyces daqingensis]|uniref:DUF3048 domain-containing protein n=1 Tax=Streptomyces daqingensis TaxID=1472640 RepID=A0ABQ2M8V2_9ACTN|nr:DUF3048 domain-containing protein [Streptomyces daqingensis]GGO48659.1 hypothetical protein GCM10012287_24160 [Streptomyces daqingensis]